jgi:sulfur carrier protein ThiS
MHRLRQISLPPLLLTVLAGLLASVPASADQVVYFVNGKAITVKSVEKGDRLTILEIEGGGRIGVPTAQIARIEDLQLSAPAQGVAAPPVQVAPTQNAPVAPAVNTVQPPATAPVVQQAETGTPPPTAQGEAREAPGPVVSAPKPSDVHARPVMPSGASRQFGLRGNGAINQGGAGMRRGGARNGSFRGRPMASFEPPQAPSDRRKQDRPGNSGSQAETPPAPPAQEPPPAVSPPPPETEEPAQTDDAPPADDQDQAEPPAEPEGSESAEER